MVSRQRINFEGIQTQSTSGIKVYKKVLTVADLSTLLHSFTVYHPWENDRLTAWFFKSRSFMPHQQILVKITCTDDFMHKEDFWDKKPCGLNSVGPVQINDDILHGARFWDGMTHIYVPKKHKLQRLLNRDDYCDPDTRLRLLVTTDEMAYEMYRMYDTIDTKEPGVVPIVQTKKFYKKVTANSPIYFVDCEMCDTVYDGYGQYNCAFELTRVTLIDENGDILLETFVKPKNRISNYLTAFSGITEEVLRECAVTLKDVQLAFQRLLPSDAILCGQSIESDLKALRLAHPYCIDTGTIFDLDVGKSKMSLRELAYFFLNENIQTGEVGHCSYQDAHMAQRLLKLKLDNGVAFGITELGFDYSEWANGKSYIDRVQRYEDKAGLRDFFKKKQSNVATPSSVKNGKCGQCEVQFYSYCAIPDCLCKIRDIKYCCKCIPSKYFELHPVEKECIDFEEALLHANTFSDRPSLRDAIVYYRGLPTKVLVAKYGSQHIENEAYKRENHLPDDSIVFRDMSLYGELGQIEQNVFTEVVDKRTCFIEYDATLLGATAALEFWNLLYKHMDFGGIACLLLCSTTESKAYFMTKE